LFVGLPGKEERMDILKTLLKRLPNFNRIEEIADVARACEGCSRADLDSLLRRPGYAAIKRGSGMIELVDFEKARSEVKRSVQDQDMKRYERLRKEWGDGVV